MASGCRSRRASRGARAPVAQLRRDPWQCGRAPAPRRRLWSTGGGKRLLVAGPLTGRGPAPRRSLWSWCARSSCWTRCATRAPAWRPGPARTCRSCSARSPRSPSAPAPHASRTRRCSRRARGAAWRTCSAARSTACTACRPSRSWSCTCRRAPGRARRPSHCVWVRAALPPVPVCRSVPRDRRPAGAARRVRCAGNPKVCTARRALPGWPRAGWRRAAHMFLSPASCRQVRGRCRFFILRVRPAPGGELPLASRLSQAWAALACRAAADHHVSSIPARSANVGG